MPKCPECSTQLPMLRVIFHAAAMGGPRLALRCPGCARRVYLKRTMKNVVPPLLVLVVAFTLSWMPPLSDRIFGSLGQWAMIARAEVWALSVFAALGLFLFLGSFAAYPADQRPPRMSVQEHVVRNAINLALLGWMFFIIHELLVSR